MITQNRNMNQSINFIAIDDNFMDQLTLIELAKPYSFLVNKGTFNNVEEGLIAIQTIQPDLVFFDIEMHGLSGVELLKRTKQLVPIAIFVTSHPEFALEGFELSAFDYILKPLTEERFETTINRLQDYWQMKHKAAIYDVLIEKESIVIKEGYNQIKLPLHEIIYLEAMQDYTKIVTTKKNYLTLKTLSAFLNQLAPEMFQRIHRSFAVASKKITQVQKNKLICGGVELPIGKTYKHIINTLN